MNTTLLNTYQTFVATDGIIDAGEAQQLVSLARDINAQNSRCCSTSYAGDSELASVFQGNRDQFDPAAQSVVDNYLHPTRFSSPSVIIAPVPVVTRPIYRPGPISRPGWGSGGGWARPSHPAGGPGHRPSGHHGSHPPSIPAPNHGGLHPFPNNGGHR